MVNSILRRKATPVYSDVDADTFGSNANYMRSLITNNTKLIVAQHSFGNPCNIQPIIDLAKSKNIWVLEDCALTLGSKYNGKIVGNFGDAALFSTDHTKPINTFSGGMIYTNNIELATKLRKSQSNCEELPESKQIAIFNRILIEKKLCNPKNLGKIDFTSKIESLKIKLFAHASPYLSDENGTKLTSNYPYPAKMPTFLAVLGLYEIARWNQDRQLRISLLHEILRLFSKTEFSCYLPGAYKNNLLEIIPLRFAWTQPDSEIVKKRLGHFIQVPWIWFQTPIISTNSNLSDFGYKQGTCNISENVGKSIINIPCNLEDTASCEKLLDMLRVALS
ncbi:DegT/DnrJ/EryC1/StrS family aminotransferase, partial [Gammaproteobacteria bacterium]|nr:DegT/DnrJ/EryC1/StrS family aminotransferase [Gammaproteobacteria bacterium]